MSVLVQSEANTVVDKAIMAIGNTAGRRQRRTTFVTYTAIKTTRVGRKYSCGWKVMYHVCITHCNTNIIRVGI
jgi:hypothetical protein